MGPQLLLCWTSVLALAMLPSTFALSSGCGKFLPSGFSSDQTTSMEVPATNGQPVRHYKVHLSANYQNNRGHAIVFSFHGHNGDMAKQEDLSQLSQKGVLINGAGIIAVYPMGKVGTDGQTAWQGAPYSASGVDDIAFVNTMISTLERTFCVDSSRIYATGKSNGAGFVNLLACTPSIADKFAAFATVSAAFYTTTFNGNCPTQRAIPILDFHGTADSVASYNGGQAHGATEVSVDNFRQGWTSRNGCQDKPTISHLSKGTDPQQLVEIQTWNTNCKTGGIVIGYKITAGQHSWPRTTLPAKCNGEVGTNDCTTTVFDATSSVIIPFFNKYTL
jgi:poly(3-hydroxybutyrate) depolymerase